MRVPVRISLAGAVFALTASAAFAGTAGMHSELAAKLAGMGEHGIVNLTANSSKKQLCWTFTLTTKGITGASVHVGQKSTVLVKLGKTYAKKGCATASAMTLEHLESKPGSYWVFVDTKGHPGDLRGKLFAGMAHM
ncbi:MAG TPA: CHRD domain-containing protein [Gaiellaceae bacterium]|nr:CHRD domain-containing protein [Gaiellaceae bacterium]